MIRKLAKQELKVKDQLQRFEEVTGLKRRTFFRKGALPAIDPVFKKMVLAADEHVIIPADRQNYLAEIVARNIILGIQLLTTYYHWAVFSRLF